MLYYTLPNEQRYQDISVTSIRIIRWISQSRTARSEKIAKDIREACENIGQDDIGKVDRR